MFIGDQNRSNALISYSSLALTNATVGGVSLSNGIVNATISNASTTSNSIGGVVLSNGTVGGVKLNSGALTNVTAINNVSATPSTAAVVVFAGQFGSSGNVNGTGTNAVFSGKFFGMRYDSNSGCLYSMDGNASYLRKTTLAGVVTPIAGGGGGGNSTDGTGTNAGFAYNCGRDVAFDSAGNIYVCDASRLRKVTPAGVVTTVAGSGTAGNADGVGTNATFNFGIAMVNDPAGSNLYMIDATVGTNVSLIRKIALSNFQVTTIATSIPLSTGTGSIAWDPTTDTLIIPITGSGAGIYRMTTTGTITLIGLTTVGNMGMTADTSGNAYISDYGTSAVWQMTPAGVMTKIAGGNGAWVDGLGSAAGFNWPWGMAFDPSGNLYVADQTVIRKISFISGSGGVLHYNGSLYTSDPTTVLTLKAPTSYRYVTSNVSGTSVDLTASSNYPSTTFRLTAGPANTITFPSLSGSTSGSWWSFSNAYTATQTLNFGGTTTGLTSPYSLLSNTTLTIYSDGSSYRTQSGPISIGSTVFSGGDLTNVTSLNTIATSAPATVTTFAGNSGGNTNGTGTNAQFNNPWDSCLDPDGNLYIVDRGNNILRKVTPGGVVTTFAGSGTYAVTSGTGTNAAFNNIYSITYDTTTGTMIVGDGTSVRRVTLGAVVTTIAGNATAGSTDATGTNASFNGVSGVVVDPQTGNIFCAEQQHIIRKVTQAGVTTLFAGTVNSYTFANGTGTNARFYSPNHLATDGNGTLYVADYYNYRLRAVNMTSAVVSTLAGNSSSTDATGVGTNASFAWLIAMAYDPTSSLLYTSTLQGKIMTVSTVTAAVNFFVGSSRTSTLDGVGTGALLGLASSVSIIPGQMLYFTDADNARIRKVILPAKFNGFTMSNNALNGVTLSNSGLTTSATSSNSIGGVTISNSFINNVPTTPTLYNVVTVAGNGTTTTVPVDGTGTNVTTVGWVYPGMMAYNAVDSNIYFTESTFIRKYNPVTGVVVTLCGTSNSTITDGTGTNIQFNQIQSITFDASYSNLYIGDFNRIRKYVLSTNTITSIIGNTSQTSADGTGTNAVINRAFGVVLDAAGSNLYFVDFNYGNNVGTFRKYVMSTGVVTTPTLSGVVSHLGQCYTLLWDTATGTMLGGTGASGTPSIIRVTTGGVTTLVTTVPNVSGIVGICLDPAGNIYATDNYFYSISKITAGTYTVSMIAGTIGGGSGTNPSLDGIGGAATFRNNYYPNGIACDSTGTPYFVEPGKIRKLTPLSGSGGILPYNGSLYTSNTTTPLTIQAPTSYRYVTSNVAGTSVDLTASSNYVSTTFRLTAGPSNTITFPALSTGTSGTWWSFSNAFNAAQTLTLAGTTTGLTSPIALSANTTVTIYSDGSNYRTVTGAGGGAAISGSSNSGAILTATGTSTGLYGNSNMTLVDTTLSVSGTTVTSNISGLSVGTNYNISPLSGPNDNTFVCVSSNGSFIAALATDVIRVSSNYGITWTKTTQGSDGNYGGAMAMSATGQIIGVGYSGTVRLSSNYGCNWVSTSLALTNGRTAYSMAMSSNGAIIYAGGGSSNDIWVSSNTGTTWTQLNLGVTGTNGIYSLACSASGTTVMAATQSTNVLVSTNSGTSWTLTSQTFGPNYPSSYLSMSPDGTYLVSSTYNGFISISSNNGSTWSNLSNAGSRSWTGTFTSSNGTLIAGVVDGGTIWYATGSPVTTSSVWTSVGPTKGWKSIAGSYSGSYLASVIGDVNGNGSRQGYVWTSTNSGISWTEQTGSGIGISPNIHGIVTSFDGMRQMFVAGYNANPLFLSSNAGQTWTLPTIGGTYIIPNLGSSYNYGAMNSNGSIITVTSNNSSMYRSIDGGSTWTYLSNLGANASWPMSMSANGNVIVSQRNGSNINLSTNSGSSWTNVGNSVQYWQFALSSNGSMILAGGQNNSGTAYVYISSNSGTTWTTLTGLGTYSNWSVAMSYNGVRMVAAPSNGYIYWSSNSGATWTQAASNGSNQWVTVSASADGSKYVATTGYYATSFASIDGGNTWTQIVSNTSGRIYSAVVIGDGSAVYSGINSTGYYATVTPFTLTLANPTSSLATISNLTASNVTASSVTGSGTNSNITVTGNELVVYNGTTSGTNYGAGVDTLTLQSSSNSLTGGTSSLSFANATTGYPLARMYATDLSPMSAGGIASSALVLQSSIYNSNVTTFLYTGSNQSFTVPAGVTSVTVSLWGAGGGYNGYYGGGAGGGAYIKGILTVTPGQVLSVISGAGGQVLSANGFGGAGIGNSIGYNAWNAGNGGGASSVRSVLSNVITSASSSGTAFTYTLSTAHNLLSNQPVTITGIGTAAYNISGIVATIGSSNTFTVSNTATPASATSQSGTLTATLVIAGGGGGTGGASTGGAASYTGTATTGAGSGGGGGTSSAGGAAGGTGATAGSALQGGSSLGAVTGYCGGGGGGYFGGGGAGGGGGGGGGGSSYYSSYFSLIVGSNNTNIYGTCVGTNDPTFIASVAPGGAQEYTTQTTQGNGLVTMIMNQVVEAMRIHSNGYIGIANSAPQTALDMYGSLTVRNGYTSVQQVQETLNTIASPGSGTVVADWSTGAIWYVTSMTANFTINLTNVPTVANKTYSVVFTLVQGGSPYYINALQVAGVAQTIKWPGAAPPTPTANRVETLSFTLMYTGSAWTVLGQLTSFG
jgi:hypothetical protein